MCKRLFVTVGGGVSAGGQISRSTGLLFLLATGAVAADSNPITGYSTPFVTSGSYPWSYAAASAGSGPAPNADLESAPSGYDPTPYLNSLQLSSGSWAASQAVSISSVTGNFGVTYNFDVDMNGNTGTNLEAFQSSNPPPSPPGTLSAVGYSIPNTPGSLNTIKQ